MAIEPNVPEEEDDPPRRSAEGVDEYEWLRVPAIFCDTFVASVFRRDRVVRIAFGEWVGKNFLPFFRTGVMLPIDDARALVRVLTRQLKEADDEAHAARERRPGQNDSSEE